LTGRQERALIAISAELSGEHRLCMHFETKHRIQLDCFVNTLGVRDEPPLPAVSFKRGEWKPLENSLRHAMFINRHFLFLRTRWRSPDNRRHEIV
jgi:hypothetical protein